LVYRALDKRLAREVAIKILSADVATNPQRLTRFQQEARSASALNHPNIITVYDVGTADSISYLAMELIDGKTFGEVMSDGNLPLRKRIHIAVQISEGLAKAHAAGIVHRDLKPENIMITRDGLAKILDFGLAKLIVSSSESDSKPELQTRAGMLMGTVGYMSPEQASGREVDFRSDQFSFGAILYEMITGKRAFHRDTTVETLAAIINEEPQPIGSLNPEAPAPIRWIIERCLAKDPEDRYASTRDLARELQSIHDHFSEISSSSEGVIGLPRITIKRRKFRYVLFALSSGTLVAVLAAAYFFSRTSTQEPPALRFLTYSGHDRSPAASPDGKAIAFASDRDGTSRIWIKQLDAPGEVVLTAGPDSYPRFSPDGSMILFIHKDGPWSALWRVSVLGGEPRKLLQDVNSADWSPDGRHVVFIRIQNDKGHYNSSVGIATADGTAIRQIAYFKGLQLQHPRWSPDGKMIVARTIPFGQVTTPLFLISEDGKTTHPIDSPRKLGWFSAAAWSGSHTLIFTEPVSIVAARSSTSGRVVEQDIDSGTNRTLFWSPTLGNTLDIVSAGRLVLDAISSRENLHEVISFGKGGTQQSRSLTKGISNDREPVYSPDGESVIFSSNRSGNLDLWTVSTRSGVVRRVTDNDAEDWDPAFMRDGKRILWSSSRGGHFEIWTADADGSDARQITQDGMDAENPTPTPDGKWIIYASYNSAKLGIWKVHPDGSGATQIVAGNSDLPEVSPDGQYVLYRDARADPFAYIRVVRLSDHIVLPFKVQVRYTSRHEDLTVGSGGRCRWMPDGRSVAFLDLNENGTQGVFVQDFAPDADTSKTRRPLTGFDRDAPTESFGISPDGLRIALAGLESYSSLMLAEGVH
jgi:eukaryotic-like serine/threonine-protein kinase